MVLTTSLSESWRALFLIDSKDFNKIEDFNIKINIEEKLLGIKFDSNLSFESVMSPLFIKRQARNYTLLQEYHIT